MATLAELISQKEALEKQIEKAQKAELNQAIEQVRAIVQAYGLSQKDIFGNARAGRKSSGKVQPKYKNPETGETWSGRGRTPKWLEGKNLNKYKL